MPSGVYKRNKNHGKKISISNQGIKNHKWKGEKVSYSGLHKWVARELGKPKKCEFCGKAGLTGHKIHWANISRNYKRNLDDWRRLCTKCHSIFDTGHRGKNRV